MSLLYCINLIFSYPMSGKIIFDVLTEVIFRTDVRKATNLYFWRVNALKSTVLLAGVLVSTLVADKLDKVMSLAGVFLGMSNVLLIPAICHLRLCAQTMFAKVVDITIICVAIFMVIFGPITIIKQW